jgi:hypothetical protein
MLFDFRRPPTDARVEPVKPSRRITASARALLAANGSGRAGVLLMHPRVDFTRH